MLFLTLSTRDNDNYRSVLTLCLLLLLPLNTFGFQSGSYPLHTRVQRRANSATQIPLGNACPFSVLAETKLVAVTRPNNIQGDIGIAPAATSFIMGFDLVAQGTAYSTSSQISGKAYGTENSNSPSPGAVNDMLAAFNYGMAEMIDVNDAGAGSLDGLTLIPGVYGWDRAVTLGTMKTLTLAGTCGDVFVFKSSGAFSFAAGSNVVLTGGVTAASVFWVTSTSLTFAGQNFVGIVLSRTTASISGNLIGMVYTQTDAELSSATISRPGFCIKADMTCFANSCDQARICPATAAVLTTTSNSGATLTCSAPTVTSTITSVLTSTVTMTSIMTTACPNSISTVTITPNSTPYYPNYGSSSTFQYPPSGTGFVPPPMITLTAGGASKLGGEAALKVAGLIIILSLILV